MDLTSEITATLPLVGQVLLHYGCRLHQQKLAAVFPNLTELRLNNADGSVVRVLGRGGGMEMQL